MADVWIKRNDTSPKLALTLQDVNGAPVNISGATCRLYMREMRSTTLVVAGATMDNLQTLEGEEIVNEGQVEYEWEVGDIPEAGGYYAEVEVTFAAGEIETFPNDGYIHVAVIADLEDEGS